MNRKELVKEVSNRLTTARKARGYSRPAMARALDCVVSTYYRNESAASFPDLWTLQGIGLKFNISLDWLIIGRGQMDYNDSLATAEGTKTPVSQEQQEDVKEMIRYMEQIPRLRYELLAQFHKFKEDNKDTVASAKQG